MSIEVIEGPSTGQKRTYNKNIVLPNGGYVEKVDGTPLIHCNGFSSAGFFGNIYILPKDVSFSRVYFREGGGTIQATGFYSSENNLTHVATSIGSLGSECSIGKGCIGKYSDIIYTNKWSSPFSVGQLSVTIPWYYDQVENPAIGAIQFSSGTHQQQADSNGTASIQKAGSGVFTRSVGDLTSGDGCTIGN